VPHTPQARGTKRKTLYVCCHAPRSPLHVRRAYCFGEIQFFAVFSIGEKAEIFNPISAGDMPINTRSHIHKFSFRIGGSRER